MSSEPAEKSLKRDQLGVPSIVFLVLAAVAPLTGAIVVLPIAIGFGNGGGLPLAVVIVAIALLLFAIGYAQMSKELISAGGFYAIAVKGLGRGAGLVTGLIATLGYNAFVAGGLGTIGFFTGTVVFPTLFGFEVHWYIVGAIAFIACFLLARRGIHVSAVILGIALIIETSILIAFSISVLINTGFDIQAFTLALGPEVLVGGSVWIAFLLVATVFLGFEATALFSEEAKSPRTTVPRSTYAAIIVIGLLHGFVAWAIVSALGVKDAQGKALDSLAAGDLTINLLGKYLGPVVASIALVLLVVSVIAAQLAFHNSAARYLYALGRARVLPVWLAKTNRHGAPERALLVNLIFGLVIAGIFAIAVEKGPDGAPLPPVLTLVPVGIGFATLAILIVQTIAALSVVVHFRRAGDKRLWSTLIAPGLGFLALLGFSLGATFNFTLVAGSEALYVQVLPWLLVVVVIGGVIYAQFLKARKPDVYAGLESDLERFDDVS